MSTQVNPQEFGLMQQDADNLTKNLKQVLAERAVLEQQYAAIVQADIELPATAKQAGSLRKLIKANRTQGIEAWHKREKEFFLRGGQFVDAMKNREAGHSKHMEENLEQIEKHQELKEKARILALGEERATDLSLYDPAYSSSSRYAELGDMGVEEYNQLFLTVIKQYEAEQERIAKEGLRKERKNRLLNYWYLLTDEEKTMDYAEVLDFEAFYNGVVLKDEKHRAEAAELKRKADELADQLAEERRIAQEKADAARKVAEQELAKERAKAEAERKKAEAERKAIQSADHLYDTLQELVMLYGKQEVVNILNSIDND